MIHFKGFNTDYDLPVPTIVGLMPYVGLPELLEYTRGAAIDIDRWKASLFTDRSSSSVRVALEHYVAMNLGAQVFFTIDFDLADLVVVHLSWDDYVESTRWWAAEPDDLAVARELWYRAQTCSPLKRIIRAKCPVCWLANAFTDTGDADA